MSWTHKQKSIVWNKAQKVEGQDPNKWRKDVCNAWIGWIQFGNRDSQYGWEMDHIDPNGGDDTSNLQPLQWQNNVAKSDGRLVCVVTSSGVGNAVVH